MLKIVLKYLDAYIETNHEVLDYDSYAEVKAARAYIVALMETPLAYALDAKDKEIEKLKKKSERIRNLLITVMREFEQSE